LCLLLSLLLLYYIQSSYCGNPHFSLIYCVSSSKEDDFSITVVGVFVQRIIFSAGRYFYQWNIVLTQTSFQTNHTATTSTTDVHTMGHWRNISPTRTPANKCYVRWRSHHRCCFCPQIDCWCLRYAVENKDFFSLYLSEVDAELRMIGSCTISYCIESNQCCVF